MGTRLEKNSKDVSKRIAEHTFSDETGEEYEASKFGGFGDYMRRKKIKLQNLDAQMRADAADKPKIFRGVVVYVNGYTQPSLSDLHVLIVTHGGGFLQYLDGKTACTHIVASQLTPKKKAEFARYRIVKPAWVVESVNAGRVLPWDDYRVVDEGVSQKVLGFQNGHMVSQANKPSQSYKGQTETSWYASQFKRSAQDEATQSAHEPQTVVGTMSTTKDRNARAAGESAAPLAGYRDSPVEQHIPLAANPGDLRSIGDPEVDQSDSDHVRVSVHEPTNSVDDESTDGASGVTDAPANTVADRAVSSIKGVGKRQLTAEEHNAILLQNPHMAKSSTANPDFLNQYYRESRLHHLSHWKAELKAQLQARAMEKSSSQKARIKRPAGTRRYVMHIDFDSFFAAVSLRKHPHLVNKPVVIAHGQGSGSEIASCNYPARKYGVKNGMWMKSALALCPDLQVLPYDFKAYEDASRHFYDAILAIDGLVQSISIDEALLDVSELCIKAGGHDGRSTHEGSIDREQAKATELAQQLRTSVKEKTGCDVSVGIGGNILLAKVALRKAKPAGQHLIKPEEVVDFIGELTVTDLPGVAYSLSSKLEELGVKLVKDIRSLTKERMINALGPRTGEKLWDYARGIDKVEVGDQVVRKSVSAEINWGIRFITQQQAEDFVQTLCDELHKRLLDNAVRGRQLTMKIMRKAADAGLDPPKHLGHGKCDTFNKSVALGVSTNDPAVIGKEAISILRSYGFSPGELRGLGVQMQKLEPLKPVSSAGASSLEGSQRRLQFRKPAHAADDRISGNPDLPSQGATTGSNKTKLPEQIEDAPSPATVQPPITITGATGNVTQPGDLPLNISGTQFVLPTQVDPTVLAELPADVRARFTPKQKSMLDSLQPSVSPASHAKSRSSSPYISDYELPTQSQLDPDTLAELPDDLQEEVLAQFRTGSKEVSSRQTQSILPQSPRKMKPVMAAKKAMLTPGKMHKASAILGRGRSKTRSDSASTLTQSSFVSLAKKQDPVTELAVVEETISQSFLEELPEDIRAELLAEQKQSRMKQKSGLNVDTSHRRVTAGPSSADASEEQQQSHFLTHPQKPTFTSRKLSELPELRHAMSAWVQEFSGEGEDGPFEEDTEALGQYLTKVVREEEDISKAAAVIEWLAYLIDDWPFPRIELQAAWSRTLDTLRETVQRAATSRGLAPLNFAL